MGVFGLVQFSGPKAHQTILTLPTDERWKAVRKAVATAFSTSNMRANFPGEICKTIAAHDDAIVCMPCHVRRPLIPLSSSWNTSCGDRTPRHRLAKMATSLSMSDLFDRHPQGVWPADRCAEGGGPKPGGGHGQCNLQGILGCHWWASSLS